QLQALGRIHSGIEAREAIETAQDAGFENINIDLMFALPGQDANIAKADVEIATTAAVQHISYYQLTLEPNTVFYRRPPVLPDDDQAWLIQRQGQQLLEATGYAQYEVSAFSQAGRQCRHNLHYWRFADYLGIGAGAHAKISHLAEGTIQRFSKLRHPQQYISDIDSPQRIQQDRQLARSDRLLEFCMNALRLTDGFSLLEFEQTTGLAIADIEPILKQAEQKAWLHRNGDRVKTTALGSRFLDDVLQLFMTT
ncbi:MAG: radical SAM family heme chaperone HemW, partial [Thiohalomonadales bacterium]